MANLNFNRGYEQFCGFWPLCTNNYMTNLCSSNLKHVSRTTFMCSYRIPGQISGFGNIKSSYGQFEPFANVIAVLRFLAITY